MPAGSIVSVAEFESLLASGDEVVLLDVRKDRAAYDAGHLPGAIFADANAHLSSANEPGADAARGGRHPLPGIERWCLTIGEWGITPSTNVIAYDDQSGANAAARAWWMLRSIGHERVAVLDGGIPAALAAGMQLTTAPATLSLRPPYPCRSWLRAMAGIDTVDRLRSDPDWMVLDVRSASRFAGREEPIDLVAGHIPGAVNLPFVMNLDDDVYETPDELRRIYQERLAGVPPDHLIVHCGSGVTACHTLLALEIAGLQGASLYVGGWSEWSRNPRPRASG